MPIRNACVRHAVLRTQQLLVGASIVSCWIWGADHVGRHVLPFLTAIGARPPVSWPLGTSVLIVDGHLFLTRVLAGSVAVALSFAASYAAVRLCLSLGALVFELAGAPREQPCHRDARDGRD